MSWPRCRLSCAARVSAALAAGISSDRLLLDPGFGFGKTLQHNLELLRRFDELSIDNLPLLAGISRKSMLVPSPGVRSRSDLPAASPPRCWQRNAAHASCAFMTSPKHATPWPSGRP
jgi:dihydropteroate synthase